MYYVSTYIWTSEILKYIRNFLNVCMYLYIHMYIPIVIQFQAYFVEVSKNHFEKRTQQT